MVRRHRTLEPRVRPRLPRPPPTLQDLLPLLEAASISPAHIQQIAHRYGPAAPEVVRTHPYQLVRDIGGIPFHAVDALGRRLGRGQAHSQRLRAGIREILQRASPPAQPLG
jgi:hypothetical protein